MIIWNGSSWTWMYDFDTWIVIQLASWLFVEKNSSDHLSWALYQLRSVRGGMVRHISYNYVTIIEQRILCSQAEIARKPCISGNIHVRRTSVWKPQCNSRIRSYRNDLLSLLTVCFFAETTHSNDICYLWFTPSEWEKAWMEGKVTARDLAVADNFGRVYTQFAKEGHVDIYLLIFRNNSKDWFHRTSGWPESGSDYKFMNFDDSLDQMSNNWRAMDHYVFTEVR